MSSRRRFYARPLLATAASIVVLTGVASAAPAATQATPPATTLDDTYYQDALGKTGTALKSSLHTIISDQTKLSYSQVWDALKATDQDPANSSNVILLYTGRSQSKSENGGNTGDWNREHVWAKSHGDFGTATGPGTDIHHLRPEDVQVNSIRGNKDFDNGGSAVSGRPATSPTVTPSNRATRSRGTWPG